MPNIIFTFVKAQKSPLKQFIVQYSQPITTQNKPIQQAPTPHGKKKAEPKKNWGAPGMWQDASSESVSRYNYRLDVYPKRKQRVLFKNKQEALYITRKLFFDFCSSIQIKSKEPKFKRLKTVSKDRKGSGRKPVVERVIQTGITIYLSNNDLKRIGGIQLVRSMCRDYITTIIEGEPYYIPEREYLPRPAKMKPYQITVYLKRSDIENRFNDILTFKEVIAAWFTSLMQELNINNYSIARFKKEQIIKYL